VPGNVPYMRFIFLARILQFFSFTGTVPASGDTMSVCIAAFDLHNNLRAAAERRVGRWGQSKAVFKEALGPNG